MINFENCEIGNIVIHKVGNKYEGGELTISDNCFLPDDPDVISLLKNYFLSPFKKMPSTIFRHMQENWKTIQYTLQ